MGSLHPADVPDLGHEAGILLGKHRGIFDFAKAFLSRYTRK